MNQEEWELHPIPGQSGDAYMGVRYDEKLFFKRNTSPFVATLAAAGLVPKLKWTERTYSGDLLTAQEWSDGRILNREDMYQQRIVDLIYHIHHSEHLLIMLKRVGGRIYAPQDFIEAYQSNLPPSLQTHQYFNSIIQDLQNHINSSLMDVPLSVCHGDLNHHNFIEQTDGKLYIVDWEEVKIADPVSDLTLFLLQYFPPSQWNQWLANYGVKIDYNYMERIEWYSVINCLRLIKQFYQEGRLYEANQTIMQLKPIYQQLRKRYYNETAP